MLTYLDGKKMEQLDGNILESSPLLCFATPDDETGLIEKIGFNTSSDAVSTGGISTRYETHIGFDYLSIHLLSFENGLQLGKPIHFYLTTNKLLVISEQCHIVDKLSNLLDAGQIHEPNAVKVLYFFFNLLFAGDSDYLEDIEEELEQLEQRVIQNTPDDCTSEITEIRKRLLVLKRYYEGLVDLLEDLEENLNGFFSSKQLRSFRMHTNRADRLSNSVRNLREYASQVREAYQNQLDISLNQTMKLFTVITAIFFPLTLLVGWYGMNVKMPEIAMLNIYPVIIVASLVIAIALLVYFKIKKWF